MTKSSKAKNANSPVPQDAAKPAFLPYGRQTIEDDDIAAVSEALRSDYLTTGPLVPQFEKALADAVGAKHAVVCSSGTAALYMAARALKLGRGSKVIVPSITFLATASAPHLAGAEIVFADVDPDSGLMRPCDLEDAIARAGQAHAVFNVHLNGQCGEVDDIAAIAHWHDLAILDDASHAIGTTAAGRRVGENAFSDLTVFSFHPVKTVTMGEGGAVTTNHDDMAEALTRERNHGMTRDPRDFLNPDGVDRDGTANPWYYELVEPGFNWRATDIQCALGLSQLAKLDRFSTRRRALATAYDTLLTPYAPTIQPVAKQPGCEATLHLYPVLIDFDALGTTRAAVIERLARAGIGTQVHYYPLHRQRYYAQRYGRPELPGADSYYARVLSLPFFPSMAQSDVSRVVEALARVLGLTK
jgi:UDP-4-amino-4,6-dideoxy-N-acetyl-beta-L-altrosamine transaminase